MHVKYCELVPSVGVAVATIRVWLLIQLGKAVRGAIVRGRLVKLMRVVSDRGYKPLPAAACKILLHQQNELCMYIVPDPSFCVW